MKKTYAPKQAVSTGRFLRIGAMDLHYEEYGSGKPLLLLHGFGGSGQNWYPFIGDLSAHYRLILVDLRGHGYSTNPENTFTHRKAAEDVFLLLDSLKIVNFSAIGMSSGGMTLLHMAIGQPNRIESMILISATSHFPEQARAIMRRASLATMPEMVREMYRECAKRGDEQIHQLITQFNAFADSYDDMNFTSQSLAAVAARTLVIHGDRDNFFPVEIPERICHWIPDATLWIIPGGDHVPIFDSKIQFISTALQFLNTPCSSSSSSSSSE